MSELIRSVDWLRIIGNCGTSFFMTVISMLTANGLQLTQIPPIEAIKVAVVMGLLYAGLAFCMEIKKIAKDRGAGQIEKVMDSLYNGNGSVYLLPF